MYLRTFTDLGEVIRLYGEVRHLANLTYSGSSMVKREVAIKEWRSDFVAGVLPSAHPSAGAINLI